MQQLETKLLQDIKGLNNFQEKYNQAQLDDFIPCLYLKGRSHKVMIHFHANGEDIAHTWSLLIRINREFKLNIICVEYPGYGIYALRTAKGRKQKRCHQIIEDAETVYNFIVDVY